MGRTMVVAGLVAMLLAAATATAGTLVRIDDLRDGDLVARGFELTKPAEIDIEGVGLRMKAGSRFTVYAWILDHETREPIWVMQEAQASRYRDNRKLGQVEKTKFFEKGKYELYMYAGNFWSGSYESIGLKGIFDILGDLVDEDEDWDRDEYVDECYVELSSREISTTEINEFEVTGDFPGTLVAFNQLGDDEYIQQGFTLDRPMNIRIYSLVEHPRGYKTPVDYGWIINADTREKVWEMDRWNTERAGRGRKNRKFDDEIRLEKGNYMLTFTTDDSHSFESFNVSPPYDPLNWGITLLPGQDFDQAAFHMFEAGDRGKALVDLTRARDNDYYEEAFKLTEPASLRVCAFGEYSNSDREFVDYGWIIKADSREPVWEMTKRNTEHAGGADKNRMFDGLINLEAGKYLAYYVTDGSHSYRDWNASRPIDPAAWGLAIYPGPDFDRSKFAAISEEEADADSEVLVRLTRVRDHRDVSDRFTLDDETRIHIYTIGEGSRGEMYDYGWIENTRNGRAVWEMTWRNTDPAGGASKNRKYDGTIVLEPGTYEVFYTTDGSHSFGDWNAARPRDPMNWGITVRIADESVAGK